MTFFSPRRAFVAGMFLVLATPFTTAQESKPAPAAAPAAVPTGEPITMKYAGPEVGQIENTTSVADTDMNVTVTIGGQEGPQIDQKRNEATKCKRKTLAVKDGRVVKREVTYTQMHMEMSSSQGEQSEDGPAVGKTLILEEKADGISVTDAEGKPVSDEIKQSVVERESSKGKMRQYQWMLGAFLAKKPVRVGETLTLPDEVAHDTFGSNAGNAEWKIVIKMTLKEKSKVDGKDAYVWTVDMLRSGEPQEGLKIEVKIAGTATFLAETGQFVSLNGTGPIKLEGGGDQGGQQIDLDGEGTVKTTMTLAIETAKPAEAPKK